MRRRAWWLTAIGVLITAVMLFPVYWMINVSLTQTSNMRKSPPNLIPIDGTLAGYTVVLQAAAALPRHQPAGRDRHGAAHARARRARQATRWPSSGRAAAGW